MRTTYLESSLGPYASGPIACLTETDLSAALPSRKARAPRESTTGGRVRWADDCVPCVAIQASKVAILQAVIRQPASQPSRKVAPKERDRRWADAAVPVLSSWK